MDNSATQQQPIELPAVLPLVQAARPPFGKLSTAALAWAMIVPPVGLILSIIVLVKAKKAGTSSRKGIAALIIGASLTIIETVSLVLIVMAFVGAINTPSAQAYYLCSEQDNTGTVSYHGYTYTCDNGTIEQVHP